MCRDKRKQHLHGVMQLRVNANYPFATAIGIHYGGSSPTSPA